MGSISHKRSKKTSTVITIRKGTLARERVVAAVDVALKYKPYELDKSDMEAAWEKVTKAVNKATPTSDPICAGTVIAYINTAFRELPKDPRQDNSLEKRVRLLQQQKQRGKEGSRVQTESKQREKTEKKSFAPTDSWRTNRALCNTRSYERRTPYTRPTFKRPTFTRAKYLKSNRFQTDDSESEDDISTTKENTRNMLSSISRFRLEKGISPQPIILKKSDHKSTNPVLNETNNQQKSEEPQLLIRNTLKRTNSSSDESEEEVCMRRSRKAKKTSIQAETSESEKESEQLPQKSEDKSEPNHDTSVNSRIDSPDKAKAGSSKAVEQFLVSIRNHHKANMNEIKEYTNNAIKTYKKEIHQYIQEANKSLLDSLLQNQEQFFLRMASLISPEVPPPSSSSSPSPTSPRIIIPDEKFTK